MEIKKFQPIDTKNKVEKKEREKPEKKCFDKTMISRKLPKKNDKKPSVFDIASKKEERKASLQKVPEPHFLPQHGEMQEAFITNAAEEVFSTTPISELTSEMVDLMEEMTHFILVESENGVRTTTIVIERNDSILDGIQITMDHYDTAPHSFNLQLSGSPETLNLFNTHLPTLQNSLETHQALQGFHIHILPPILSEKPSLHLSGKEKKGWGKRKTDGNPRIKSALEEKISS